MRLRRLTRRRPRTSLKHAEYSDCCESSERVRNRRKPPVQLCKSEVTGSIPVRSISKKQQTLADHGPTRGSLAIIWTLSRAADPALLKEAAQVGAVADLAKQFEFDQLSAVITLASSPWRQPGIGGRASDQRHLLGRGNGGLGKRNPRLLMHIYKGSSRRRRASAAGSTAGQAREPERSARSSAFGAEVGKERPGPLPPRRGARHRLAGTLSPPRLQRHRVSGHHRGDDADLGSHPSDLRRATERGRPSLRQAGRRPDARSGAPDPDNPRPLSNLPGALRPQEIRLAPRTSLDPGVRQPGDVPGPAEGGRRS
jgi:hypothetical protein